MPRRLSSEVDKVVIPGYGFTSTFRASQKSLQLFQGSSSSAPPAGAAARQKTFSRKQRAALYTCEIGHVQKSHSCGKDTSRSLDRSRLFDRLRRRAGTFATFVDGNSPREEYSAVLRVERIHRGESRNVRLVIETGIALINPICRAVSCVNCSRVYCRKYVQKLFPCVSATLKLRIKLQVFHEIDEVFIKISDFYVADSFHFRRDQIPWHR